MTQNEISILKKEVEHLRALEEIEKLPTIYCHAVDTKDIKRLMSIFSDDVRVNSPTLGFDIKGKNDLQNWFTTTTFVAPVLRHKIANMLIDIKGNMATGAAYYMFSGEMADGPSEGEGRYRYEFRKISGVWKITHLEVEPSTPVPSSQ